MNRILDARDVFEIAEQIERNGARFYRRAAELVDDSGVAALFRELAAWEVKHEELFAGMRKALSERGAEEGALGPVEPPLDAKAMAGLAAFGLNADPSEELTGAETRQDVLRLAIDKEKDIITYQSGLKGFVAARADRDRIDDIICEELRHIRILNQALGKQL